MRAQFAIRAGIVAFVLSMLPVAAWAEPSRQTPGASEPVGPAIRLDGSQQGAPHRSDEPLSLMQGTQPDDRRTTTEERTTVETHEIVSPEGYLGASEFFNVREANPNVAKGQWELRLPTGWSTRSDGTDDDTFLAPSLKYGIDDDTFVGLELYPLNIGDGGDQGNGDLGLVIFRRLVREQDAIPAVALWARMRIPTGDGSSGVDGEFYGNVTKTLAPKMRAHFQAFAITANGERGGSGEDRRHFQWGFGPGFDYQVSDSTLLLLNYAHRVSDQYGFRNVHVLEFGVDQKITTGQNLKVAFDVGLNGDDESPNFGAKLEYAIVW